MALLMVTKEEIVFEVEGEVMEVVLAEEAIEKKKEKN